MTNDQYQLAMQQIERLAALDPSPDTEDGKLLLLLVDITERHEIQQLKPTITDKDYASCDGNIS